LKRQRRHCQVWWRHSIGAPQRRQRSKAVSTFSVATTPTLRVAADA